MDAIQVKDRSGRTLSRDKVKVNFKTCHQVWINTHKYMDQEEDKFCHTALAKLLCRGLTWTGDQLELSKSCWLSTNVFVTTESSRQALPGAARCSAMSLVRMMGVELGLFAGSAGVHIEQKWAV